MNMTQQKERLTNEYVDHYLMVWAINALQLKNSVSILKSLARVKSGQRTSNFKPIYLCYNSDKTATANGVNTKNQIKASENNGDYYSDEAAVIKIIEKIDLALKDIYINDKLHPLAVKYAYCKKEEDISNFFQIPERTIRHRVKLIRKAARGIIEREDQPK